MRHDLYVPAVVKASIRDHVESAVQRAVHGYLSASEDEDTLTGHLGALLSVASQRVVEVSGDFAGVWTWSLDYYKFRGRGAGATERILGADGVFEVRLVIGGRLTQKSLLFQAKNNWSSDPSLLSQCIKLSTWREAAFVLNYTPDGFLAYSIDEVIRTRGVKRRQPSATPFAEYLGGQFLDCLVGNTNLHYDPRKRKLIWRTMNNEVVATRFSLGHRFAVKVVGATDAKHLALSA